VKDADFIPKGKSSCFVCVLDFAFDGFADINSETISLELQH
jgi:hypothetical protein